jgi:hypothetical protein
MSEDLPDMKFITFVCMCCGSSSQLLRQDLRNSADHPSFAVSLKRPIGPHHFAFAVNIQEILPSGNSCRRPP